MTFDAREVSMEQGAPIELYTFRVYGTNYYYTSAGTDQTLFSIFYQRFALNRSEIEETDEIPRNDLTIDCPLNFPILGFYESAPPSDVILLTIQRLHRGDTELVNWWRGRVLNGKREGGRGKLYCENKFTRLKQTGLRRVYSGMCPHILYGSACRANELDFTVGLKLDGVSGIQLDSATFAAKPDGYYAGGIIYFEPSPGRLERRGIKSHVGNQIEITHPIASLQALDDIVASPGCGHTREDCKARFDNIENFGGFPFVPKQNPMGNTSVF